MQALLPPTLLAFALLTAAAPRFALGQGAVNVVWLVAEDFTARIPPFGDSTVATPHLSRLAAEGVRYPNTFSPASTCSPSRAALNTGMYPTSIGAHNMRTQTATAELAAVGLPEYGALLPPEVEMLSQQLRRRGYFATNNLKTDYQWVAPPTAWDRNDIRAHFGQRAPGQPFFSVYNLYVTHETQVYRRDRMHLRWRPGFDADTAADYSVDTRLRPGEAPVVDTALDVSVPPYLPDTRTVRRDLQTVYANARAMDEHVGFLLAELEAAGVLDSTVVMWYGDHGGPLPRGKRNLYDGGIGTGLIVRYPPHLQPEGIAPGAVDSQLISFVDFAPTVLSLTGAEPPAYMQGRAWAGPHASAKPRTYIYAASDRFNDRYDRIRAVRDRRYKYLRNYYPERGYYLPLAKREAVPTMQELLRLRDAGELTPAQAQFFRKEKPAEELFDTHMDPHELHNLVGNEKYGAVLARMRGALDAWQSRVGDLGAVDERELVAGWWGGQLDSMPRTAPVVIDTLPDGRLRLTSATSGANIGYRWLAADAGVPGWRLYGYPIEPATTDALEVVAQRIGYRPTAARVVGE